MERQFTNLVREARIRRGIILYGNTRDEHFLKAKDGASYVLLPEYLTSVLTDAGFEAVGKWNRRDGLTFKEGHGRRLMARWLSSGSQAKLEGQEYDIGEPTEIGQGDTEIPPLKEFAEVVVSIGTAIEAHDRACAFILDWTDYQFSGVQRPLAEEDRTALESLSVLMCGRNGLGGLRQVTGDPPAVVILITASLGAIPPMLYQQDSRIKLFNLTMPEKSTRAEFFGNHLESLSLKRIGERSRAELIDGMSDMTDGMRTVDLIQIVRLCRDQKELTPERLLNLYRFGERRSPWEELAHEKLVKAEETLGRRVVGQDAAVKHVVNTVIKSAMGLSGIQHNARLSKPKGVMFFVGPTGVGKTELAKATAEFLFGDENACIRFDMSEFSHEESDQRLIGAPPGYVGFEEGGQLTNAVLDRPFSVLLFDEIEKAHPRILDKFLQILEDGRLTDGKGVTAYFSETIIIFTSNIGASEVDLKRNGSAESIDREFRQMVKAHFNNVLKRPELLNRIGDNVVVFQPVADKMLRQEIIRKKVRPLIETIEGRFDIFLRVDDGVIALIEANADSGHGGRGLLNAIERILINPLSEYMFYNGNFLKKGRTLVVTAEDGKVGFSIIEG